MGHLTFRMLSILISSLLIFGLARAENRASKTPEEQEDRESNESKEEKEKEEFRKKIQREQSRQRLMQMRDLGDTQEQTLRQLQKKAPPPATPKK